MAALNAALAFPQVADRAGTIAQYLHLDMAGVRQVFFDVYGRVTESELCFGRASCKSLLQLAGIAYYAHAATPAAGDCLDEHFGAAGQRREECFGFPELHGLGTSGQQFDPAFAGQLSRIELVTERDERVRRRADERDAGCLDSRGKLGVLAQETVARMHSVAVVLLR